MAFRLLVGFLFLSHFALACEEHEDELMEFDDDIVEFKIPANTGKNPWNTRAAAIEVKVGQTLRIVNGDSEAHYLHTSGKPCPHGSKAFGPGEYYDCVVTKPADPDKDILYDHQHGPTSRFYVKATQ